MRSLSVRSSVLIGLDVLPSPNAVTRLTLAAAPVRKDGDGPSVDSQRLYSNPPDRKSAGTPFSSLWRRRGEPPKDRQSTRGDVDRSAVRGADGDLAADRILARNVLEQSGAAPVNQDLDPADGERDVAADKHG